MKTIFIAYNSKDRVFARFIYQSLLMQRWADIEIFMDEFSVKSGEDFKEKCLSEAKNANLGIIILSEHTQESEYVQQEVGILLSKDIPKIYIALSEDYKIPPGYEKTTQSFPLYDEKDISEGIKKLIKNIENILKPKKLDIKELFDEAIELINQGKYEEGLKNVEYLAEAEIKIKKDPIYQINTIKENLEELSLDIEDIKIDLLSIKDNEEEILETLLKIMQEIREIKNYE